jgi:hypothetical protein
MVASALQFKLFGFCFILCMFCQVLICLVQVDLQKEPKLIFQIVDNDVYVYLC